MPTIAPQPTPKTPTPTPMPASPAPTPALAPGATVVAAKVTFTSGLAGISAADFERPSIVAAYKRQLAEEFAGVSEDQVTITNIRAQQAQVPAANRRLLAAQRALSSTGLSSNSSTGVAFDVVVAVLPPRAGAGGAADTLDTRAAEVQASIEAFRSSMAKAAEASRYLAGVKAALVAAAAADPSITSTSIIDDAAFDGFDIVAAMTAPEVEKVVESESAAPPNGGAKRDVGQAPPPRGTLDVGIWAAGGALVLALLLAAWIRLRKSNARQRRVAEVAKRGIGPPSSSHGTAAWAVGAAELPRGWQAATDEGSGKTYYFNSATRESSWEPPVQPKTEDFENVMQTRSNRLRVV